MVKTVYWYDIHTNRIWSHRSQFLLECSKQRQRTGLAKNRKLNWSIFNTSSDIFPKLITSLSHYCLVIGHNLWMSWYQIGEMFYVKSSIMRFGEIKRVSKNGQLSSKVVFQTSTTTWIYWSTLFGCKSVNRIHLLTSYSQSKQLKEI